MLFQTTLNFNETLLRQAVLSFWWRVVGLRFLIVLALLAVALGYHLYHGDRSWFVGVLAAVIFIAVVFVIAIYHVHYRNGLSKLRAMGLPKASFSVSESSFTFESGAGSNTLPWSSVTEIWQFEQHWLMLFSKAQFVTLPLADISPEFRAFILERVKVSGGVII
jgi:YcxB-like protein